VAVSTYFSRFFKSLVEEMKFLRKVSDALFETADALPGWQNAIVRIYEKVGIFYEACNEKITKFQFTEEETNRIFLIKIFVKHTSSKM